MKVLVIPSAPVLPLLPSGGPADVSRRVMTIVIDAFNGIFRSRRIANILVERLKRWKQKFDSSIKVIPFFGRSIALQALFDVVPSPVDLRLRFSMELPNGSFGLKVFPLPEFIVANSAFVPIPALSFYRVFRCELMAVLAELLSLKWHNWSSL